MCHLSLAHGLNLQAKLMLSAKSSKSSSLYFGVEVPLTELLHAVTVKEVALMLLVMVCKTV